ncbi:hypothetical protein [Proteiniphilum sp.]|uniref:hypothetical protein n=1 Tax=Proteiniphilum sp. TaxID=1926877 RepID=UPI00331F280B
MDFADMVLNRFDEAEMKKNNSALVCFSTLETGKKLSSLAIQFIRPKSGKSSVTLLYFIDKQEEIRLSEGMDEYKHKILSDLISTEERDKITLRLFIQSSDDYNADIIRISEEQKSNLILLGIHHNEFNPALIRKYGQLKSDPTHSDIFILEQFEEREAETLKNLNALFNRDIVSTGLFIDNGSTQFRNFFIPILQKSDIQLFTYLYRIAQQENVKIMIWDAIGIIGSEARIQKLYQFITKKSEGRIYLWDNNKKIGCDFIREQDLVIMGVEGWRKLICTPLPWTDCIPSTLLIKETTNSIQL